MPLRYSAQINALSPARYLGLDRCLAEVGMNLANSFVNGNTHQLVNIANEILNPPPKSIMLFFERYIS